MLYFLFKNKCVFVCYVSSEMWINLVKSVKKSIINKKTKIINKKKKKVLTTVVVYVCVKVLCVNKCVCLCECIICLFRKFNSEFLYKCGLI